MRFATHHTFTLHFTEYAKIAIANIAIITTTSLFSSVLPKVQKYLAKIRLAHQNGKINIQIKIHFVLL